jgi:hypothetical protein
MINVITVALGMFGLALLGALIAAFYFLDRLIRHEYQFHREAWERDGRPVGYLFRPPEATWLRSSLAFHRCSFAWLFQTPAWVRDDSSAKRLLSRLRWFVLIWNIGSIIFFSLFFLHVAAP